MGDSAWQNSKISGREVFLLALANLHVPHLKRELCLSRISSDDISYEEGVNIAKEIGIRLFSKDVWDQALEMAYFHLDHGIKVIPIGSKFYPKSLATTKNPPWIIFAKGNYALLQKTPKVAIVGSRSASDYGIIAAKKISSHFTNKNFLIVSGLATGIDAIAHESCLSSQGETIAVLAHGLHRIYPVENTLLAHSILENKGLWISEYPYGVEPQKHFFVQRNRIQVGLSVFSIIVEARKKSGTMSHANFCIQEKHRLYVVLPEKINFLESNFEGNIWLYKEKEALPLRSRLDYP